ncbi:ADP-ribosylation [Stereum hirsutum FP-91666 SS1]|uniref:ADP-ribosylation n=1 Tax=Stereum hirsutum (strain FP-91666) TaxID=721885 RepID=UPI0004449A18|nr:ADP-ribosylation [Stereum hirsutum FP-91666 SS1]EIM84805.1 ADP-ribosylation [Stereum hirsutum FP-91666 SS1]
MAYLPLAPALVEIPAGHDAYESIERQFWGNWLHHSQKPEVIKIWKIFGKKVYVDRYMAYKDKVIKSSGYPDGNAKRRWHGTTRTCRLGDTSSHSQICNDLRCSLCSIIETSFDVVKSGKKTDWGRFGSGIYTSSTSSKADSYVHELGGSRYSTMLLNAVILGRSKELTENSPDLKQPPAGYQSVTGVPGHDLNYDECIVYDNDAIRPMYLVVYQD